MVNPVAQALQPLQPFLWGRGGAKLTPEQIAREREIAEALGTVDMSPVDHWLQGAARMANAAVGRLRESRADRAEQENASLNADIVQSLLGSIGGSTVLTPSGTSPVPATSPTASSEPMDYASARVASAHGDPVAWRNAIASIESAGSGDYQAVGPKHPRLGRALGRYQVMEANVGPWTEKYLGRRLTPEEFLASPEAQDAVFDGVFGSYVQQFGDPALAAQAWFAGPGGVGTNRQDSLGTSVPEYAQKFTTALGRTPAQDAIQAQLESLPVGGSMTMPTPEQTATGSTQPSPVAMALAPQAAPPAPVQVAQAGGGINPAIIEALSSPYVNDQTRQIAALLLQQQIQEQQSAQAQQMRMLAAQQAGIDPRFAGDDEIWKAAVGQQFRAPTTDIQEYEYARQQGFPGSFTEFQEAKRRAGATSITNVLGGEELTPGQKKIDEAFADEYIRWVGGGFADSAKQLEQLNESLAILESGAPITGPGIGSVPEFAQPFINPDGVIAREQVEEVVQRNLREILGAQFTEREGERLISRAFNPRLSPQENAKRVRRLIAQIGEMAAAKQAMVDYFNEHGTLRGYQGRRPSLSQLEQIDFGDTPQPSSQKPISEMTDEELEAIINGNR